jgi:hypothetical protein
MAEDMTAARAAGVDAAGALVRALLAVRPAATMRERAAWSEAALDAAAGALWAEAAEARRRAIAETRSVWAAGVGA